MEWGQGQRAGYISQTSATILAATTHYGLFTVQGPVEIIALYGVLTEATDTADAENFRFAFQNGSAVYTNLTADVAVTSYPVGTVLVKSAVAATATTALKPSAGSFAEAAGQKQNQGFFLNGKTGGIPGSLDTCGLACIVSAIGGGTADYDVSFYVHWVPLVSTSLVFAGFTLIPPA